MAHDLTNRRELIRMAGRGLRELSVADAARRTGLIAGIPLASDSIDLLVDSSARDKLRETASVKDFGATGGLVNDATTAFQAALNSGARRILVPSGDYLISTVTVPTGVTIEGESDFDTIIWGTGSEPIFKVGDDANNVTQHVTLRNFSYAARASFTGPSLIRVKRCFQTYLERLRYKGSLKSPIEAVIMLENAGGTSEQPVRVTIRDCYIDGADYNRAPGAPAPVGIWNTGGIQVIVENTHIQDCEIGCKLGINPLVDTRYYSAKHPLDDDFYDFCFVNNSRYQVGNRGGTTSNARAFDVWKGSGINASNAQFYLNNNAPNPALAGQRVAVFNSPQFGKFGMDQCVVNCNARADHVFELAARGEVKRLAVSNSEFGGLVGSKGLIDMGPGAVCRAVIDPSNVFDNPNNHGPVDQRANVTISPYDLGTANNHYYVNSDGAARTFTAFKNGTIGVNYVLQFEITRGSVTLTTTAAGATSGIVLDGFLAGKVALQTGDILIVTRGPLAAAEYYRAKLVRGGGLAMSVAQLVPGPLPTGAQNGWIVFDEADRKFKGRVDGAWVAFHA